MLTNVSRFSDDGLKFAYQGDILKKNSIEIYPLDPENNYKINSSLVNHIDCESNDLDLKELLFLGWCHNETTGKSKRRNSNEIVKSSVTNHENYFVNVFGPSKVVVYTETGMNIVNILKSKEKIIGMGIEGPYIWLLGENMVSKKYHYDQNKQLKSFTFNEAKGANIINFQVLQADEKTTFISICTDDKVYIIDPSKRRVSTKLTLEIKSCSHVSLLDNNKYIALGSTEAVVVYDFLSGQEIYRWDIENVSKISSIGEHIAVLMANRESIEILKIGEKNPVGTVIAKSTKILDFISNSNKSLLISWLNVNEPNFRDLNLNQIVNADGVVNINDNNVNYKAEETNVDVEVIAVNESVNKGYDKTQKISKANQAKINHDLITALVEGGDNEIISILELNTWTQERISNFISSKLDDKSQTIRLYSVVANKIEQNIWDTNPIPSNWLKLLMFYKGSELDLTTDKKIWRQTKHLKSALRASTSALPVLLGIQGRLELLKTQAQLRKELSELSMEQEETDVSEKNISYVDGEGDNFVDAAEFLDDS
uniref:Nucleolar protein n=1 Tax=Nakaseomyces delphensis TaxID=51657 RepID=A7WPF6_NAKDE|nr:nucleolar protein [Nakaseomyces delphensis]